MQLALFFSFYFTLFYLGNSAGIQFCAKRLSNTEEGDEEHFLRVFNYTSGKILLTTGQSNLVYTTFWCWNKQLVNFDFSSNHRLKIEIWEADSVFFGDDDLLGVVYAESADIAVGPVTLPVTKGGYLQLQLTGTIPTTLATTTTVTAETTTTPATATTTTPESTTTTPSGTTTNTPVAVTPQATNAVTPSLANIKNPCLWYLCVQMQYLMYTSM